MSRYVTRILMLVAMGGLFALPSMARAQSLGHRVLGTSGIHAGDQPGAGVYLVGQFLSYSSDDFLDRRGDVVSGDGFYLDAVAGAIGAAATFQLSRGGPYFGVALGVPAGRASVASESGGIERGGLGDLYLRPARLGVKLPIGDLSVSYGVYIPTGNYDADGRYGFGNGQLTHELSVGGTLFLHPERSFFLSALGTLLVNGPKRTIDLTRGSTVQVQGGIGARFLQVDLGLAAYALAQITDDTGTALPPQLRGVREHVYGVGPEIGIALPEIHAQLTARYTHDFGVRGRPEGQILFLGLAWLAWDFGARESGEPPGVAAEATGLAL